MSTQRLVLGAVQHISEHSIFFVPCDSDHLDLKTLSTAPPAHRGVLQRNGLVAKVFVGVTLFSGSSSDASAAAATSRTPPPFHASGVASSTASVDAEQLSSEAREELWRSALTYAGLLQAMEATLAVPSEYAAVPWPVQAEEPYAQRIRQLSARMASTCANTCSACVPVLSMQEYVYKRKGVRVCLCVAWMPRYTHTLQQWAASFAAPSATPVPEYALLALLHHVSTGALALRSGLKGTACTDSRSDTALRLSLDTILVDDATHATGGAAATPDTSDDLAFVLTVGVSTSHDPAGVVAELSRATEGSRSPSAVSESPSRSPSAATTREHLLYRTPEECSPDLYPTGRSEAGRRAVWSMGVLLYLLTLSTAATTQVPRRRSLYRLRASDEELPLNAAAMTPDAVWRRLRRQLEECGYSSSLVTVATQLLSLDPLTRPSLHAVERLLQDLHRPTPVRRFPFALGSYDLLRIPNPAQVHLNPGARRYSLASTCALCRKARASTPVCRKGGEHGTGTTSPSWCEDEVLPQLECPKAHYMTFLCPLVSASDERQRRRHVALALNGPGANLSVSGSIVRDQAPPIDASLLLQVFGGFALYERKTTINGKGQVQHVAVVKEVLVPYPSRGLRLCEMPLVKTTVDFTGGLPWLSVCTEVLQKAGRISRSVPFAFTGNRQAVEWFAWVLPGERFGLPNGMTWTAPRDGAFVFWFDADLQPTDRDRYYALTSTCAATLPAKVTRTVMPDSIFRLHASDERQRSGVLSNSGDAGSRVPSRMERSTVARAASALRRRSSTSITDVTLPFAEKEIVEEDEESAVVLHSALSPSLSLALSASESKPLSNTRRRRSTRTSPTASRRASVNMVALSETVGVAGAAALGLRRRAVAVSSLGTQAGGSMAQESVPDNATSPASPLRDTSPPNAMAQLPAYTGAPATPTLLDNDTTQLPVQPQHSCPSSARTPSQLDTSTDSANALQACDPNAAASTKSEKTSPRRKLVLRRRAMAAMRTETPAGATAAAAEADETTVAAANAAQLTLSRPGSGDHGGVLRSLRQRPLSGRESRWESVLYSPVGAATPKRPTLTRPVTAPGGLSGLHVCGRWLPCHAVDAVYKALTFCVRATGEHGFMQEPVKLTLAASSALHAPDGAAFIAFLSNQVPLFSRNHAQLKVAGLPLLLLPHHGFAFYDADGGLLRVLALRCSVRSDADTTRGEFELDTHAEIAVHGSVVAPRTVYASYMAGSGPYTRNGAAACSYGPRSGSVGRSEEDSPAPLRHVSTLTHRSSASHSLWATSTPENTTLSFTSARHLVGEFTPMYREVLATTEEATARALPACWVGFDAAEWSLLYTDAEQTVWVPYSIGA